MKSDVSAGWIGEHGDRSRPRGRCGEPSAVRSLPWQGDEEVTGSDVERRDRETAHPYGCVVGS